MAHHPGRKPRWSGSAEAGTGWVDAAGSDVVGNPEQAGPRGLRWSAGVGFGTWCGSWSASEKKSLHANERDTETNLKQREEFVAKIRTISPEQLIFLDESGVTTSMTGSMRVLSAASASMKHTWRSLENHDHPGRDEPSRDDRNHDHRSGHRRRDFPGYVEQVLCPALRPGDWW